MTLILLSITSKSGNTCEAVILRRNLEELPDVKYNDFNNIMISPYKVETAFYKQGASKV